MLVTPISYIMSAEYYTL